MSEITAAIARIEHHFPLVASADDRFAAKAAIKSLIDYVSATDAESDDNDRPSIPSYLKARGYW